MSGMAAIPLQLPLDCPARAQRRLVQAPEILRAAPRGAGRGQGPLLAASFDQICARGQGRNANQARKKVLHPVTG